MVIVKNFPIGEKATLNKAEESWIKNISDPFTNSLNFNSPKDCFLLLVSTKSFETTVDMEVWKCSSTWETLFFQVFRHPIYIKHLIIVMDKVVSLASAWENNISNCLFHLLHILVSDIIKTWTSCIKVNVT